MTGTKTALKSKTSYQITQPDFVVSHHPQEKKYIIPRVKDMEETKKPREKMLQVGPAELSPQELMAIVLGVGTKKEEVMAMAQRIMREYGDRSIADQKDAKRLQETLDIPQAKACQIVACFELGRRFFAHPNRGLTMLRTPKDVFEHVGDMGKLPKEHLRGLYLNSRYQLIHDEVISVGTATENLVHPREVFRPAVQYGAVAIILVHNHPSDNPAPTEADILTTEQMIGVGTMLGISVLDHVVVTSDQYMSVIRNPQ